MHLGEYRVWRSVDILFTAVFWVLLGKQQLAPNQLVGILLVFAACVVLSCDEGSCPRLGSRYVFAKTA